MVLGERELGFATRGGMLIAFNLCDGNEVWHWNSGIPELKINMATAGGGCAVETPEGLALIEEGVKKQVIAPPGSEMYFRRNVQVQLRSLPNLFSKSG
jgi:hypothetical protein